jgi:AraC-like DNA-binding protein
MTPHAKSLTARATIARSRARTSPAPRPAPSDADLVFSSQFVRPVVEALERSGLDAAALLARAGLPRTLLADPDGRVPCAQYGALLTLAQQDLPHGSLALRLAQVTPIGAHALVDYLVLSSETVGEGLRRLSRYYRLVNATSPLVLHDHEDPIRVDVGAASLPFAAEYPIALTLLHLGRESEDRAVAQWVSFMHRPSDPAEFERALGCPVHVNAGWNGFALSRDVWRLPMRRRDPSLIRLLEPHAEAAVDGAATGATMRDSVRRAQARGLAAGDATIEAVARTLAVSPRTLQRRLADEGTTFHRLLDDVRREAAERHLSDSALAIGEIAFVLGYSEPAAFHRAFRRWHRVTPQSFRAMRPGARVRTPSPQP